MSLSLYRITLSHCLQLSHILRLTTPAATQHSNVTLKDCKMALRPPIVSCIRHHLVGLNGIPMLPSRSYNEARGQLPALPPTVHRHHKPAMMAYGYGVLTAYQIALWICFRIKEHRTVGSGRMEKQQFGLFIADSEKPELGLLLSNSQ